MAIVSLAGNPLPSHAPTTAGPVRSAALCAARAVDVPGVESSDPRWRAEHLLVVRKAARTVQVFSSGTAVTGTGIDQKACYRVGLGFEPEGHKTREGDGRTPEGWYTTSDKPWSSFHAAIAVHYPNPKDSAAGLGNGHIDPSTHSSIASAHQSGRKPPQTTALGGEILLHGGGSATDWTLGCIALENADIDDLRSHLPKSMKVHIRILP